MQGEKAPGRPAAPQPPPQMRISEPDFPVRPSGRNSAWPRSAPPRPPPPAECTFKRAAQPLLPVRASQGMGLSHSSPSPSFLHCFRNNASFLTIPSVLGTLPVPFTPIHWFVLVPFALSFLLSSLSQHTHGVQEPVYETRKHAVPLERGWSHRIVASFGASFIRKTDFCRIPPSPLMPHNEAVLLGSNNPRYPHMALFVLQI